jgi:alpha-1,3-rhamnosyl/mannosyltransferase
MKVSVAVNLLWCVPGRVGGSEEYLVRQLLGLAAHRSEFDVTIFAPRGFAVAHPELAGPYRIREAPSRCTSRPLRVVLENSWLARATRSFDLVHHGGGTVPTIGNRRTVLTIHDVQYVSYPHYFSPLKRAYLRIRVPASIAKATLVTVPSRFVKDTLINTFATSEERVAVVRHGIPDSIGVHLTSEAELRGRFGLGDSRVVVYPAVTHPHKNHQFLLWLLASSWRDVVLVCAGSPGLAHDEVTALAARLGVADRVRMIGRVGDDDRDGLIALAEALVFPSLYEGFGAPLVEAMTIGTPVVCSDQAAIPEVVGDAGVVLPLAEAAWAGALDDVRSRRGALVAAGRVRARSFSIAGSAEDLAAAYSYALRQVQR